MKGIQIMLERFQGKDGRGAFLNALRGQFLVDGNTEIADKLASATRVREFAPGDAVYTQGERGSGAWPQVGADACRYDVERFLKGLNGNLIRLRPVETGLNCSRP